MTRKKRKSKFSRRGVPRGFLHNWAYRGHWKEKKIGPGLWRGTFRATKKTKSGKGGPKKGFRIHWKLWGDQYAVKTGKGRYQTTFRFKKKAVKAGYHKRKWQ